MDGSWRFFIFLPPEGRGILFLISQGFQSGFFMNNFPVLNQVISVSRKWTHNWEKNSKISCLFLRFVYFKFIFEIFINFEFNFKICCKFWGFFRVFFVNFEFFVNDRWSHYNSIFLNQTLRTILKLLPKSSYQMFRVVSGVGYINPHGLDKVWWHSKSESVVGKH